MKKSTEADLGVFLLPSLCVPAKCAIDLHLFTYILDVAWQGFQGSDRHSVVSVYSPVHPLSERLDK